MKCGEIFIAKYELKFFCSKLRIYLLCHLFEIITPLTSIKHSNPNQISYYLLLFFPPTILPFLWRVVRAISENASISKTWEKLNAECYNWICVQNKIEILSLSNSPSLHSQHILLWWELRKSKWRTKMTLLSVEWSNKNPTILSQGLK